MSTTLSDHQDTNLERILLITNLVVELPSAVLDQLSSVHKPRYALISMIMSFIIMLISVLDFVRMGRRQRVKWMKRDKIIPWFYSQDPSFKPLGTFADVVGLVCSIFQCVSAAVAYEFLSHKSDNPIKISVWPLIFAFGVLLTRFPRNHRSEIHPENPAQRNLRELQDSETSLYYGDKKKDRKFSEKIKKAKRKKREELARLKELHTLKGQVESVAELRELEIDSDEQFPRNPPPKSALERLEAAQTSQQGLQSPNYSSPSSETPLLFQDKNSYWELSEMAEEVKRRAEIARLKGHVESVVRLKGLDIDPIEQ